MQSTYKKHAEEKMDPDLVFQKTAKGREEIEKRTLRVDARRRTLLILVDGRSSASELAEKTAQMGDGFALLQSLWTEGFVEPMGAAAAAAAPATVVTAAPAAGATAKLPEGALADLKRKASSQIEKLMGPDGDAVALKLERTTTLQEFMVEAQKAREALRAFLGPRKADEFWKALGI